MLRPGNILGGLTSSLKISCAAQERTTGKLHEHPVGLQAALLDKINKGVDVYMAGLDHFGENETLYNTIVKTLRGARKRGGGSDGSRGWATGRRNLPFQHQ